MSTFQRDIRAATVQMLQEVKDAANIYLQIYPGRPKSIHPPTAFIDGIDETLSSIMVNQLERRPHVNVLVLHGRFDAADTVAQRDSFVDAFVDYVADHYHAAGALTLVGPVDIVDIPNYVPDWLPQDEGRSYYATQITLEGYTQSS